MNERAESFAIVRGLTATQLQALREMGLNVESAPSIDMLISALDRQSKAITGLVAAIAQLIDDNGDLEQSSAYLDGRPT